MVTDKKYIEQLFTDSSPINEKEIVNALKPFIVIQRDSKEIHLKNETSLTVDDRILLYGLAKKLLRIKKYIEVDSFSASEIHQKTGIKKGSIDPAFRGLKEKFIIGKGKDYEIPNYKVSEILKRLQRKIKRQ